MITVEFEMENYEVNEGNEITICAAITSGCLERIAEVAVDSNTIFNEAMGNYTYIKWMIR